MDDGCSGGRDEVQIRAMGPEDADEVHDVVVAAFEARIAADYSAAAALGFRAYAARRAWRSRLADHVVLVAIDERAIVGVCEVRPPQHVSMLFVRPDRQRRGIGRQLVAAAVAACKASQPGLAAVTVASTPFAVPVYRRLGFVATGALADQGGGIVAMPMVLHLG